MLWIVLLIGGVAIGVLIAVVRRGMKEGTKRSNNKRTAAIFVFCALGLFVWTLMDALAVACIFWAAALVLAVMKPAKNAAKSRSST